MGLSLSSGLWIVVGLLSITAVAAGILLLMMLLGRKAVNYATVLSFIVSVLAHLAFACAYFAWYLWSELHPAPTVAEAELPEAPPEVIEIQELLPDAEEALDQPDAGNTPLADALTPREAPPVERFRPEMNELPQPATPERQESFQAAADIEIPDLPSNPDRPAAIPEPVTAGATGPLNTSRIPLEVEIPERDSRPEIEIPRTAIERTPLPQVAQTETEIQRSAQTGSVEEIRIDPEVRMTAPDLVDEPDAQLQREENSFEITQRAGPTPSLLDDLQLGTEVPSRNQEGSPGNVESPSITRTRVSEPIGLPGGSLERMRPNVTPTAPRPEREGFEVTPSIPSLPVPTLGATTPNVVRPDFDAPLKTNQRLPETFRLRDAERRTEIVERFGGTKESVKAVEAGLEWLARHQEPSGRWNAQRHGAGSAPLSDVADLNLSDDRKELRRKSGIQADNGVTALALLAFLAHDNTNERGQYSDTVSRALKWLITNQRDDGFLGGEATYFAQNYCHGMATYALAEALAMQDSPDAYPELRTAVEKAVSYSLLMQLSADGGWRYSRTSSEGDMSMFGWQLMALKSAELAGVKVPEAVRNRMIQFLRDRSIGARKGLASYRPGEPPTQAMTAEALFCKQILGIRRDNPQSQEAAEFILRKPPKLSEWNLYYWYYGTMSMFQYGEESWEVWNNAMQDTLVKAQRNDGDFAGSWDPVGPWGPYGGRVYSTALGTLCLEVYYRYLPMYKFGDRFGQ